MVLSMVVNYDELELVLKALSDTTRREILELLRGGELSAGQIHRNFDLAKSTISHHLSILHNAKLIKLDKFGGYLMYQLTPNRLDESIFYLQELRGDFDKKKQRPFRV